MILSLIFFLAAALLMVYGLYRTTRFLARNAAPAESLLHPLQGFLLWTKLARKNAFGTAGEPERRTILRIYLLALAAYAVAVLLLYVARSAGTGQ